MKLFGQLVRTVVNVALIPVAVVRDVGDLMVGEPAEHTADAIDQLKDEASEKDDD